MSVCMAETIWQTCVCNITQQSERNRCIHATRTCWHNTNNDQNEKEVFCSVYENPWTSTRQGAYETGLPQNAVECTLRKVDLCDFHVQSWNDIVHFQFCLGLAQRNLDDSKFLCRVSVIDRATFIRSRIQSLHKLHGWAEVTPHAARLGIVCWLGNR
jgi:hypothetical protein